MNIFQSTKISPEITDAEAGPDVLAAKVTHYSLNFNVYGPNLCHLVIVYEVEVCKTVHQSNCICWSLFAGSFESETNTILYNALNLVLVNCQCS